MARVHDSTKQEGGSAGYKSGNCKPDINALMSKNSASTGCQLCRCQSLAFILHSKIFSILKRFRPVDTHESLFGLYLSSELGFVLSSYSKPAIEMEWGANVIYEIGVHCVANNGWNYDDDDDNGGT